MKINDVLVEFAPAGGGDSGNYFQALASAWYNGVFDTGSLPKGIKTQQDVERLLNRGIVCPDGKTRKLHIDYNSDFDGVEIYSDDYYEYGDHDDTIDSRTGQKWGTYDFMAFSDEDLSEGLNEFATDDGDSGRWYTDDQMTDLVGDGWWQDMDVSGANIGVPDSEVPKAYMIQQAQRWLKRQGYSVQVLNCKANDDDMEWYIEGAFPKDLTEFAADDGDSGGEDDALRKYARMWWNGDDATQQKIEAVLARMGWEIGEDEGGYDNGGVFVVRAGDEHGRSYTSWAAEDLTEGVAEDSTAHDCKHCNGKGYHTVTKKDGTKVATNCPQCKGKGYIVTKDVAEGELNEKSTSQAQFRTMAAAAHDPEFAKKVGIKQSVAREFNRADRGQDYKSLPKKATEGASVTTTPGSIEPGGAVDNFKQQMANNTEKQAGVAEAIPLKTLRTQGRDEKEANYGDDYQAMVQRVKRLAGLGPLKTVYDPNKRVYKNMPTAEQPKK